MGEYPTSSNSDGAELNMFELVAMAKRLNISFCEMKEISFVTLINILFANIEEKEETEATQNDIDAFF